GRTWQGKMAYRCDALASGHTGLASSICHTGVLAAIGPSDFRNTGDSPVLIQKWVSGGCLPASEATAPATPPIFTFATKVFALRCEPAMENESSPWGVMMSLTTRGFGVAATSETVISAAPERMFFTRMGTRPFARSSGKST